MAIEPQPGARHTIDTPAIVPVHLSIDVHNLKRVAAQVFATTQKYGRMPDQQDDLVNDLNVAVDELYRVIGELEDVMARIKSRER